MKYKRLSEGSGYAQRIPYLAIVLLYEGQTCLMYSNTTANSSRL